jgi:SAM-dependent methyltransferase
VYEILHQLRAGELVLDLGSRSGSFSASATAATTIRADLDPQARESNASAVQADAARLPFRDGCFSAIISNHSLEHFEQLDAALGEIGRVLRSDGTLFIAVPDASTLTDRIYRWLGRGGGHVNAFTVMSQVIARVQARTGLEYAGGRLLCTSLSFLNSHNHTARAPRKLLFLGGGNETVVRWMNGLFRLSDLWLGTRLSIYGWAIYFGPLRAPVDPRTWVNVCIRCGSGHESRRLLKCDAVEEFWGFSFYTCPLCGASNLFHHDEDFAKLR